VIEVEIEQKIVGEGLREPGGQQARAKKSLEFLRIV